MMVGFRAVAPGVDEIIDRGQIERGGKFRPQIVEDQKIHIQKAVQRFLPLRPAEMLFFHRRRKS